MEASLLQKLKENHNTMLPMHMPGHKRNLALSGEDGYLNALCADCDITEIAGFDNLAQPEDVLLALKQRAAKLWKSEESFVLVNGSTGGVLAAIYGTVPVGGHVVMARNCHKSVYNGLRLVNAKVTYLLPEKDEETGTYGVLTPKAVEAVLKEQGKVDLLVLTSPTYEGGISDVRAICEVAHGYGVPVLVDSAHGAHLGFGSFPEGAVECGGDLVVQSLHKTLPSLTQTALLHRKGNLVNPEKLRDAVTMFQTSSPSYLLMASVDGCLSLLEEQETRLFRLWQEALETFYKRMAGLKNLKVIGAEDTGERRNAKDPVRDPSKLIIVTSGTDCSGSSLMETLREEYRIEAEMAAEQYVIAMTGPGDTKESLGRLADALLAIDDTCKKTAEKTPEYPKLPRGCMTASQAMEKASRECKIKESCGKIAAEYVWAYPPGIPLLVPGEEITEDMVKFLLEKEKQGIRIHRNYMGAEDSIRCLTTKGQHQEGGRQ